MLNFIKRDFENYRTMPWRRWVIVAFYITIAFMAQVAMATQDVRVVGPVVIKSSATYPLSVTGPLTKTQLDVSTVAVKVTDGSNLASVVTGPFTGVKGLRVYGGPTDPVSDVPVFIEFDHHQVHEGETYVASHLNSSVASGSSVDYYLSVPVVSTPIWCPHMVIEVITTAETELFLYASPTFTSTGTVLSSYNKNRNSSATADLVIGATATINATGNTIWIGLTGSGRSAGNDRHLAEFILKSNTLYGFRAISRASGDKILVRFVWYEDEGV